jgi:hypothetical protein
VVRTILTLTPIHEEKKKDGRIMRGKGKIYKSVHGCGKTQWEKARRRQSRSCPNN